MTDDATKKLRKRKLTRENIHNLWEIAKTGNLDKLSGEEKWLAKVMLEHQDEYFNQFEMADLTHDHEYDVESDKTPFYIFLLMQLWNVNWRLKIPLRFTNSIIQ